MNEHYLSQENGQDSKVYEIKPRSERRRRNKILPIRMSEEEIGIINERASACGMTCAEYLRRLGTGYIPSSKLDQMTVRDLCQVSGDLGRLGGLLKLWIVTKRSVEKKDEQDGVSIKSIDALWRDIQVTYDVLRRKVVEL